MRKSKELFFATFDDDKSFWDDYLTTFMMKRVNIIITASPRHKGDKKSGVHPVVVAAATFTMEKDFIVLHSFAVRDNNVDISKSQVIIGNENDWRGLGLGRFLLQFGYLFHHCCFFNGIVPLLVQTSKKNEVAMDFYKKHGFIEVVNKNEDKLIFHELDWDSEAKKKLLTMWGSLRLTDQREMGSVSTTTTFNLLPDGVLQLSSKVTVGDQETKTKDDNETDTDASEGDKPVNKKTPKDITKVAADKKDKEETTEESTEPVLATGNKSNDATGTGDEKGSEEKEKQSSGTKSAKDNDGTQNTEDTPAATDPVPTTSPDVEIPTTGVASKPKSSGASGGDSSDED